ncbi:MetQ/NlpA family ABC transporter substrate-binding protein [Effusibacillus dendaii]|uniref:Lipoprotein n=1 Tax=Effusibacillus dendaii TaxID=2743772 RepID=A0A7I8DC89_9BACL|nr:MetQ/NlpA family ABC transporter substrate-binding protein [Effusibacillus dendaii]BCJ85531.1 metal ABC transporter substrate-binding protein [Effusibacillus dendaii]
MKKAWKVITALGLSVSLLAGCGGGKTESTAQQGSQPTEKKELKIGATAGPYSDMVTKAIKPIMEKKGYKVDVVEFQDYVQPNLALANGSIDANLFQHTLYLKKFAADKGLDLSAVISVPTAPMGLYSKKYKSLDEIKPGSTVAIANDPSNLARTLILLQNVGLIKIKSDVDPTKASEKDIAENPKNLKITPLEAAQLPRAVDTVDVSAVPGNFALAAKMDLLSAIKLENMPEEYRNILAVKTKDLDAQFTKDLKAAIQSKEFEQTIDDQFKGFGKPDWMTKKQ